MKIVCISDTHSRHGAIAVPDGDVLLHAGDMTMSGSIPDLSAFNTWLGTLPHKTKLITPGNHDRLFESDPTLAKSLITNGKLMVDEAIEIDGVKFYLSPWTPRFGRWSFMADRGQTMKDKWALIPEGIDVLVTHGPPMGILDEVPRFTPGLGTFQPESVGCLDLLHRVLDVHPKFHVFGHIHEGYGQKTSGGITYVNASICTPEYKALNLPIVIEV